MKMRWHEGYDDVQLTEVCGVQSLNIHTNVQVIVHQFVPGTLLLCHHFPCRAEKNKIYLSIIYIHNHFLVMCEASTILVKYIIHM